MLNLPQKLVIPVQGPKGALREFLGVRGAHEDIVLGVAYLCAVDIHGKFYGLLIGGFVVFTESYTGAKIVQHSIQIHNLTAHRLPVLKYPLDAPGFQIALCIGALFGVCLGQGKVEVPVADRHIQCWPDSVKRDIFLEQLRGLPGLQLDLVDRQRIVRVRCAGECQEDEIAVVEEVAAAAAGTAAEVLLLGQLGDDPVIGAVHVHLDQFKVILKRDTVKMVVVIPEGHL